MAKLTLSVVCHKEVSQDLIKSWEKLTYIPDIEVLFNVQGFSPEAFIELKSKHSHSQIKFIYDQRSGISNARNNIFDHAQGAWVSILDHDVTVPESSVHALLVVISQQPEGMIYGNLYLNDGSARKYLKYQVEEPRLSIFSYNRVCSVMLCISKKSFEKIGRFDSNFGIGTYLSSGEEADFILRALNFKIPIQYVPQYHVFHPEDPLDLSKIKNYARGFGALYVKYWHQSFLVFLKFFLDILLRLAFCLTGKKKRFLFFQGFWEGVRFERALQVKGEGKRTSKWKKKADFFLGVPLVFILGFFQRKRRLPPNPQSLAIVLTAAIGDTALFSALVFNLKRLNPELKIDIFTGDSNYQMAQLSGTYDHIFKLSEKNPFKAFRFLWGHRSQYDVVMDLGQWPRLNALYVYFIKAKFKLGFKTPGQYRHFIFDQHVLHSKDSHEEENFQQLLHAVFKMKFDFVPRLREKMNSKRYVIFHLSPSGEKSYLKEWDLVNWKELGQDLIHQGFEIYLTGAPMDEGYNQKLKLLLASDRVINLAGKFSLEQTLKWVQEAALVVSVNTGIMHLAWLCGVKTLSLNGPTAEKRWGPKGTHALSVSASIQCAPCLNLGFEYGCHQASCMKSISIKTVKTRAHELLGLTDV